MPTSTLRPNSYVSGVEVSTTTVSNVNDQSDTTYIESNTGNALDGQWVYEIDNTVFNFDAMSSYGITLRAMLSATGDDTWNLRAYMTNAAGTAFGTLPAYQVVSATGVAEFTFSNQPLPGTNNKTTWDGARIVIDFQNIRNMGSDSNTIRVAEASISATYTISPTLKSYTTDAKLIMPAEAAVQIVRYDRVNIGSPIDAHAGTTGTAAGGGGGSSGGTILDTADYYWHSNDLETNDTTWVDRISGASMTLGKAAVLDENGRLVLDSTKNGGARNYGDLPTAANPAISPASGEYTILVSLQVDTISTVPIWGHHTGATLGPYMYFNGSTSLLSRIRNGVNGDANSSVSGLTPLVNFSTYGWRYSAPYVSGFVSGHGVGANADASVIGDWTGNLSATARIGQYGYGLFNSLDADIAAVAIWHSALTDTELVEAATAMENGASVGGPTVKYGGVAFGAANGGNPSQTFTAEEGDLVVIVGGHSGSTEQSSGPLSSYGYTQELYSTRPNMGTLGLWTKVMGSTPDTEVTCYGTGVVQDASAYTLYVISSASFDVGNITWTDPATSELPDPPAISVATDNSLVITSVSNPRDTAQPGTPPGGYTHHAGIHSIDSNRYGVAAASKEAVPVGGENPGTFGFNTGAQHYFGLTASFAPVSGGGGSNTATTPSVNTTTAYTRLISLYGVNGQVTAITPDVDQIERGEVANIDVRISLSDEARNSTGATGANNAALNAADDWVAQILALKPEGAVVTNNLYHGVDLILKRDRASQYAVDVVFSKTRTRTHLVDAIRSKKTTRTYSVNAVLRKTQTKIHSVDALRKKTQVRTYFVNAIKLKKTERIHSVSAIRLKKTTRSHTVSALLQKRVPGSHSVSAILQKRAVKTHSVTSYFSVKRTREHLVNAVFVKKGAPTHSVTAILLKKRTRTHLVDALKLKRSTNIYSADALIKKTRVLVYSVNVVLRKTRTVSHSVTAILKGVKSISHNAVAYISKTKSAQHSVDANVQPMPRFMQAIAEIGTYWVTVDIVPVEGEAMIAQLACRATQVVTNVPEGWTLIRTDVTSDITANGSRQYVYYKIAGASEPGSYTWGLGDV